jgi:hypothetical protein
MKMKFKIKAYSQVFNRVCTGYSGLKNFLIVDQNVCFPREGYNLNFIDILFHIVHSTPTSYEIYIRLQKNTITRTVNGSVYFMSSAKSRYLECLLI